MSFLPDIRIGFGSDIHRLMPGRDLFLGGVKIPFEKGLNGHSDADALLHAIMDALLGALALGDIGYYFPDTSPEFKNISSRILLEKVMEKVNSSGFQISNIDSFIHCERPKIAPFREEMRQTIAKIVSCPIDRVSVKAGTNEGLGAVGEGKAIQCEAMALLIKSNQ